MAGVLDEVNRRTQLAGNNRMELLLFRLNGRQRYGINVFKVREVMPCPAFTRIPRAHPDVCGLVTLRGTTLPIIDLSHAIGLSAVAEPRSCFLIVTEYNRRVQAFLVNAVDRIVNMRWDDVQPPPKAARAGYLTAVTKVEEELIEIIDVEKVLSDIAPTPTELSSCTQVEQSSNELRHWHILVADDSSVARKQIHRTLEQLGIPCTLAENGKSALEVLRTWVREEPARLDSLLMVISDVEMPEMDGYTLTAELRREPVLASLYVLLHTSLSGVFNQALVEKVGANRFIAKFNADELGEAVLSRARSVGAVPG
jgi:two-component system chemotaxis response regulator CheV